MEIKRKTLQGVLNILNFNRHFYIAGLIVLLLITASWLLLSWSTVLFYTTIVVILYGLLMPLIVSAYVYDFSGYYEFKWLKECITPNTNTTQIVNINAGFDETSYLLDKHFPNSQLQVFDFYDPKHHTEPAIVRARKVSMVYPQTKAIETHSIPLFDQSIDLIFLLSSAHEIRSYCEKVKFLKECRRICKPGGKVIMVEHLRDISNFLAFSVGFTHFFSKKTWKNAYAEAGFSTILETKFTPFMSIFNCQP